MTGAKTLEITRCTLLRSTEPPRTVDGLHPLRIKEGSGDIARFVLLAPLTLSTLIISSFTPYAAAMLAILSLEHLTITHGSNENHYDAYLHDMTSLITLSLPGVNLVSPAGPLGLLAAPGLKRVRITWDTGIDARVEESTVCSIILGIVYRAVFKGGPLSALERLEIDERFGSMSVIDTKCKEQGIVLMSGRFGEQ